MPQKSLIPTKVHTAQSTVSLQELSMIPRVKKGDHTHYRLLGTVGPVVLLSCVGVANG